MGSFQSKNTGPQIRSPRHGSIGGRLRVDSPNISKAGVHRALSQGHSISSRLGNLNSSSPKRSPGPIRYINNRNPGGYISEGTPLLIAARGSSSSIPESARMLSVENVDIAPPPLTVWIGPALACAFAYALYNIFIKKGSASLNPVLGGVILQFVAALLGCLLLGGVLFFDSALDADGMEKGNVLEWDWTGVQWAILAGISVGFAEMISFSVSGMGVQAMQSIPIIIGGSVMFGTVLGSAVLGETLTMRGWSGVFLISVGIGLVGMDDDGTGT